MTTHPTRVAIVVEPDAGALLTSLVRAMPVWVLDTPINRSAAEEIWAKAAPDSPQDLTTFKVDAKQPPDVWVAEILPVVDEHHGLRADWASDVHLEVYGVGPTQRILRALEELGSFEVQEQPGGFLATRGRAV